MSYRILPSEKNLVAIKLKNKEAQKYLGSALASTDPNKIDHLSLARVISGSGEYKPEDIILYQEIASHKTNFGVPKQVLIPLEHIEGKIDVNQAT